MLILQQRKLWKLPNTRGMIVWGGQLNLAPVDSEIIDRVERPLSLDLKVL